ncbi:hypothetical protein [Chelativorans sp. AA-79]|uniref:hypothetical protein n=1 Tax=Chelativorans sp. AA-79 TaxID=3028735 RepID=UPI0023F82855|nr:hypothetical protein [Chelativorans sp. AA-79]WEX07917.1 hypothetical protein PVE73_17690 [Chelativorans sp. AA-79]
MSAKFPKERKALEIPAASAATALPPAASGKAPAKTLSGAFAAALGGKPQLSHPGQKAPTDAGSRKPPLQEQAMPRIRNSKPGAPLTPRKGHR